MMHCLARGELRYQPRLLLVLLVLSLLLLLLRLLLCTAATSADTPDATTVLRQRHDHAELSQACRSESPLKRG